MPAPEPFVPTPEELISPKIDLAPIAPDDLVFDLGCGDGRVLVRVVERIGARCVGIEVRPELARDAAREVAERNLGDYIRIRCQDYHEANVNEADVVLLYLNRGSLGALSEKLETELRPGARVVTHSFDLPGWQADRRLDVELESGSVATLYRYVR